MQNKEEKIEYVEDGGSESFEAKYQKLKKKLKKCGEEKQEYLNGWQRARAELQNSIKKKDEEARDFRRFAEQDLLMRILPVLDNLNAACESLFKDSVENAWVKGFLNIKRQLEGILKDSGVEEIKADRGSEFDPAAHEAVEREESNKEEGIILEILQKGYALNGKIIRPARVKVSKR